MLKRWWWILLVMLVVGPVAGLLVGAAVTYVMPKKFESSAKVEFKGPEGSQRHLVAMKSTATLREVSNNLELPLKWGLEPEATLAILRNIVSTETLRGTDLGEIRVRHTSPGDAREITAEVVKVYGNALVADDDLRSYEPLVVIEEPLEPRAPVSPNVALNLAGGTGAGLLLAIPLGLLLMAALHRLIPPKQQAPPPLPAA